MWRQRISRGWSTFKNVSAMRSALQWLGWWDTTIGGGKTIMAVAVAFMAGLLAWLESQPRSMQFVLGLLAFGIALAVCSLFVYLRRSAKRRPQDDGQITQDTTAEPSKQPFPAWSILGGLALTAMMIVGLLVPPKQLRVRLPPISNTRANPVSAVTSQSESPKADLPSHKKTKVSGKSSQQRVAGKSSDEDAARSRTKEATLPTAVAPNQQVPTVINSAPGGIANSGTIGGNATVNNFAPPPPVCSFTSKELPVSAADGSDAKNKMLLTVSCDQSITSPTFEFGFNGNVLGNPRVDAKTGGIGFTDNQAGTFSLNGVSYGASSGFAVTMLAPPTLTQGNELYITVLSAGPIKLLASRLKK